MPKTLGLILTLSGFTFGMRIGNFFRFSTATAEARSPSSRTSTSTRHTILSSTGGRRAREVVAAVLTADPVRRSPHLTRRSIRPPPLLRKPTPTHIFFSKISPFKPCVTGVFDHLSVHSSFVLPPHRDPLVLDEAWRPGGRCW